MSLQIAQQTFVLMVFAATARVMIKHVKHVVHYHQTALATAGMWYQEILIMSAQQVRHLQMAAGKMNAAAQAIHAVSILQVIMAALYVRHAQILMQHVKIILSMQKTQDATRFAGGVQMVIA